MKKTLFILFVLISSYSFAQNGWFLQYTTQYPINNIYFLNENTGWACGDSGFVAKTTNGGLNWIGQYSPIRVCYKSIHFINENTGWVAGGDDYILSTTGILNTTNGGANWYVLIYSGGYSTFSSIYILNKDTVFAALSGYSMYQTEGGFSRTTNGGVNWQPQVSGFGGYQFSSIHFINNLTGWVLAFFGNDTGLRLGRILKTTNCGANWVVQLRDSNLINSNLKQIKFVNSQTGFAAGEGGRLLKTTDGGDSWIRKNTSTSRNLFSVSFINENTGWIGTYKSGDTSGVLKTTNGGENWIKSTASSSLVSVGNMLFVNALTGWACSYQNGGIILKSITGGLTNANNITSKIPDKFSLSQNYPNPFNPNTNIKFALTKSGFIKINVFDALGREVKNLVNENLPAGEYEVSFDGGDLNSGIYFYKLETDGFTETKKMILIK
ncbi:MAG: T9SS type A sorting domain-containing protein [Bacteroidetes bacterium]|nr:T9SS type A sorting domain-containing protein [Bacteroidota bacterium]